MMNTEILAIIGGQGFLGSHLLFLIPKYIAKSTYYTTPNVTNESGPEVATCSGPILSEIWIMDNNIDPDSLSHPTIQTIPIYPSSPTNRPLYEIRLKWVRVDIVNYDGLREALRGASVVIHMASLIDQTARIIEAVNVIGTRNVVRACVEEGITRLIYTSTVDVSVGFGLDTGSLHRPAITEGDPITYPSTHLFPCYGGTKMRAEIAVRQADQTALDTGPGSVDRLRTVCLRPTAIYGPLDRHFVTKAIVRGIGGMCPNFFGIGKRVGYTFPVTDVGLALFQASFIGNVAWAHLRALDSLNSEPHKVGGQVYFVCDDTPPMNVYDFVKPFMEAHAISYIHSPVPIWAVKLMGKVCGLLLRFFPFLGSVFPIQISAFLYLYANHIVSYDKAKRSLGYEPIYDFADSMRESIKFYLKIVGEDKKVM